MIFSVNLNTKINLKRRIKRNACKRFGHQMYNWNLPHVNSSLNVWGIAIWQHAICTVFTDRSLWSSHTNDTYSMFNQYPQPTTQQPRADSKPVFSSLRTMNSERKGLRVNFAFFQRNYSPDGRMNETVAKVEELSDLWKPGAVDETPPFVMNCNCI